MSTDLIHRLRVSAAEWLPTSDHTLRAHKLLDEAADALERLTVEHHNMRARLGRAVCAAEEHFGEDAIRYKLSLFANGRARNVFPRNVDGHWFALQRADNDAHIGLSLRCLEAEAERDNLRHELEQLKRDQLRAEVEALRADRVTFQRLRAFVQGYSMELWEAFERRNG